MTDLAYKAKGSWNDSFGHLFMPGELEERLESRLEQHKGKFHIGRMKQYANRQEYVEVGPWRVRNEARNAFADRIRSESHLGTIWKVESQAEPRWWLLIHAEQLTISLRVMTAGLSQRGVQYIWAAEDPDTDGPGPDWGAFDCSGYTKWCYSCAGIYLPHNADAQQDAPNTIRVYDPRQADLVMMDYQGVGYPTHVGLWYSPGRILDTRSWKDPVGIRDIEPWALIGFWRPVR